MYHWGIWNPFGRHMRTSSALFSAETVRWRDGYLTQPALFNPQSTGYSTGLNRVQHLAVYPSNKLIEASYPITRKVCRSGKFAVRLQYETFVVKMIRILRCCKFFPKRFGKLEFRSFLRLSILECCWTRLAWLNEVGHRSSRNLWEWKESITFGALEP